MVREAGRTITLTNKFTAVINQAIDVGQSKKNEFCSDIINTMSSDKTKSSAKGR